LIFEELIKTFVEDKNFSRVGGVAVNENGWFGGIKIQSKSLLSIGWFCLRKVKNVFQLFGLTINLGASRNA
jgi:hypothetical protein